MIDNTIRFISPLRRGLDVTADLASDEPSHIHIARPSRVPRRDTSPSSASSLDNLNTLEPANEVRDLAAEQAAVQAA
jgi:hypothetical protein